jgi:hypothetical protein
MESTLRDFVLSIPVVTRYVVLGTLALTLAGNWGLVDPFALILSPAVYESFQVRSTMGEEEVGVGVGGGGD